MRADFPQWALDAEVRVSIQTGPGRYAGGSGTIVAANNGEALILTCKHVAKCGPADATYVESPKIGRVKAKSVIISPVSDLAAIIVDLAPPAVVPVVDADDQRAVWSVGFGVGSTLASPHRRKGRIVSVGSNATLSWMPVSGDSGSGVFTEDGKLCGVVWGYIGREGKAVPVAQVQTFLETCCPFWSYKPQRPDVKPRPDPKPEPTPIALEPLYSDVKGLKTDMALVKADQEAIKKSLDEHGKAISAISENVKKIEALIASGTLRGKDGRDGLNGKDGKDGKDGASAPPIRTTRQRIVPIH